jgi:Surp module
MIKLTAQYTAAGGRQFLATLAKKEASNEQFQVSYISILCFCYRALCSIQL